MSPRSKKRFGSLPPFGSPRSEMITLKRQADRVIAGRMDWGAPIGPRSANTWQYTLGFAAVEFDGFYDAPEYPAPSPEQDQEQDHDRAIKTFHSNFNSFTESRAIRFPVYCCPSETMAANIGALSPSSSPRLPSPPPFPEVQIGPRSPIMNASANTTSPGLPNPVNISPSPADPTKPDDGSTRRIRPGTKAADMASGPPLVPLAELDSPFQLQEHLKALYHDHTKSDRANTTMALSRETARILANPPEGVDRSLWLYELCRLLVMKANSLIVAFFEEKPPCSSATCPEMRASEWQYLCAVHDPPKSCCAIDYCCHTLDWAANVLTSQKNFPSRLTLGSETTGGSQQGLRQLTNIFRRVYRIFAHAWFQHRQSFWEVEGREGLYILFKTVCDAYALIPEENYTISPEAEGIVSAPEEEKEGKTILRRSEDEDAKSDDSDAPTTISTGATTRRHKNTPSTGAAVTTIAEGDEDDNQAPPSESVGEDKTTPVEARSESALRDNPEIPRPKSAENRAKAEDAEEGADRPVALEPKLELLNLDSTIPADSHKPEDGAAAEAQQEDTVIEEKVEPEQPQPIS